MISRTLFYIVCGYFLGGVLFARVFSRMFYHEDVTAGSMDANPGSTNAFVNGGFACGMLSLLGDLAKGFLPVFLYINLGQPGGPLAVALVMAAPVAGHIFTPYYGFRGGKGNATTFGVLAGFLPDIIPVGILIILFIFYSLVIKVSPNFQRTIITYLSAIVLMLIMAPHNGVRLGFLFCAGLLLYAMHRSPEERKKTEVRVLWMH